MARLRCGTVPARQQSPSPCPLSGVPLRRGGGRRTPIFNVSVTSGDAQSLRPRIAAEGPAAQTSLQTSSDLVRDGDVLADVTQPAEWPNGLAAYRELKEELDVKALQSGGGLTAYILLATLGDASCLDATVSCATGVGAALLYLSLLGRYVDSLGEGELGSGVQPPAAPTSGQSSGNAVLNALGRMPKIVRQALAHPRLLVPVVFVAAATAWNEQAGADAFHFALGPMFVGFLSYKVAVLWLTSVEYRNLNK